MKSVDKFMENVLKKCEFKDFSNTKNEYGACDCSMDSFTCECCQGCTECEVHAFDIEPEDYGVYMIDKKIFDLLNNNNDSQKIIDDKMQMLRLWDTTKDYLIYRYVLENKPLFSLDGDMYSLDEDRKICYDCIDEIWGKIDKEVGKDNKIKVGIMKDLFEYESHNLESKIFDYIKYDEDVKKQIKKDIPKGVLLGNQIEKNFLELKNVFDNETEKMVKNLDDWDNQFKHIKPIINERER